MKYDKYEKYGAYHYKWYDDPNWAWYKECVDRIVRFCDRPTIDVGGGDGLVAKKLIENGVDTIVLENDPHAIAILKNSGVWHQNVDLDSVRPYSHNMDYICSLNVIEHLKSPQSHIDLVRQAREGAIIITDKATEHKGRYHEHEYTLPELMEVFKEFKPAPFKIESTEHGKPITFIGVEIKK